MELSQLDGILFFCRSSRKQNFRMGRKCVVPFCRSGYASQKKNNESNPEQSKVSVFKFPLNDELKKRWIASIPREN